MVSFSCCEFSPEKECTTLSPRQPTLATKHNFTFPFVHVDAMAVLGLAIAGGVVSFAMAFAIGANDVANGRFP